MNEDIQEGGIINPKAMQDLLDLADDDENPRAFLNELIDIFIESSPPVVNELMAAVEQQKSNEAARLAHKLKGFSANLGIGRLTTMCSELEQLGNSGQLGPSADKLSHNISETFEKARRELETNWRK